MKFWVGFVLCLLLVALMFLVVYLRRWRQSERERRVLEEALERERARARAEERRKKDLVAFLAHDLKTPLTSVVGYLTLLRDRPDLPAAQRAKFTGVALDKAQRLEALLEEFFDISRMELRQEELRREPVALTLLLEQLTDEFYPLLMERRLSLDMKLEDKLTVVGDANRLARVFDNVLRNAVSYSREGSTVRLTARREGGEVHVRVSNTGLGIPEGELAHIFEKFYRLDAARSSRTGGAGLGLAIAKEIVDSHGGTIAAESTGETTQFHIVLPAGA